MEVCSERVNVWFAKKPPTPPGCFSQVVPAPTGCCQGILRLLLRTNQNQLNEPVDENEDVRKDLTAFHDIG